MRQLVHDGCLTAHLVRPQFGHTHMRGCRGPVPGSLTSRTYAIVPPGQHGVKL